ncbi:MAG: S1 RNA-binding domain-containing protein [Polyangiaceae bacterium]
MFEENARTANQKGGGGAGAGTASRVSVRIGSTVEGVVVHVGRDDVFVELEGKRQAFIDTDALRNDQGEVEVAVGDKVRARVIEVDDRAGTIRLAKAGGKTVDVGGVMQAREAGVPVEGKITGVNKGGYEVDLGKGVRGFCPASQMPRGARPTAPAGKKDEKGAGGKEALPSDEYIGQSMQFHVLEIKEGGRSIVLSRRSVLEAGAREQREQTLAALSPGKVVHGIVTAVRDFGAFVDIGGLEALLPGSELSHERGASVQDRIEAGQNIEAQVLEIKQDSAGKQRVTLSLKAMLPAPEKPAATGPGVRVGAIVTGEVVRIETYGVFVQLEGTDGRGGRGLIPQAELGVARGVDLRKAFPEGTKLTAKVLETGDGRLKLSVRGAKDDAERKDYEAHKTSLGSGGFGTFGDLLAKAAAKNKKK